MKKPSVFKNNCAVEIIPVTYLQSLVINNFVAQINMISGYESFPIDAVAATISSSCTNQSSEAGDTYKVSLSFRIAYTNPTTTHLLNLLKNYGSIIAKFTTPGNQTSLIGTDQYPVTLTYSTPSNFDGYEVTLSGTQDIPPPFIPA